jgi:hypothetical protein
VFGRFGSRVNAGSLIFGIARAIVLGIARAIAATGCAGCLPFLVLVGALVLRGEPAWAQKAKPDAALGFQKGKVLVSSADVYSEPNFDSRIVGRLKGSSTWTISRKIYGAFYLVRISKDRVGYVLDTQIAPLTAIAAATKAAKAENARTGKSETPKPDVEKPPTKKEDGREGAHLQSKSGPRPKKPFEDADFQGISFLGLRYRENTMGLKPSSNMFLIGFKATGTDNIIQGLPTELNVQISPTAPAHYEQATGRSSEGFLFLLDGMALNTSAHGANTMTFFGFGPMFRFSKFSVTLPMNGKDEFYSLEDMAIGLKLNYGLAQRFGGAAVRLDFQYLWEKEQYYGLSLALQFSRN